MSRYGTICILGLLTLSPLAAAAEITGHYMEARTCQVYTGPCFAAGEVGLTGKEAVMAWNIRSGQHNDVDLAGLSVAMIVRASKTIGFVGLQDAERSMILVDERADARQRDALVCFAKQNAGKAGQVVAKVHIVPIDMKLNVADLTADLHAGSLVSLNTRQARAGDCICSNESAYYPPLAQLDGFVPGVTIDGSVKAHAIGSSWSIPDTRTAYMGTFSYQN
jgi:hypothetical protein